MCKGFTHLDATTLKSPAQGKLKVILHPPKTNECPLKKGAKLKKKENQLFAIIIFWGTFVSFSGWAIHQQFRKKPFDPSKKLTSSRVLFSPKSCLGVALWRWLELFWEEVHDLPPTSGNELRNSLKSELIPPCLLASHARPLAGAGVLIRNTSLNWVWGRRDDACIMAAAFPWFSVGWQWSGVATPPAVTSSSSSAITDKA